VFQNPPTLGEYRDIDCGTAFGTGNVPFGGLHKHATLESLKRTSVLKNSFALFSASGSEVEYDVFVVF
jgi:hypothetical protein